MASMHFCDGCGYSAPFDDLRYIRAADKNMNEDFSLWYCQVCVDKLRTTKAKFAADLTDCKFWRIR